jgi:hypothetical protein
MSLEIGKVSTLAGIDWIKKGFEIFSKSWLKLILSIILFYLGIFVLAFIPVIGQLATSILGPIVGVALILAVKSIDETGTFEINQIINGAKSKLSPIFILIAANIVLALLGIALGVAGVSAGSNMTAEFESGNFNAGNVAVMAGAGVLFALILGVFYFLINSFSLSLIALTDTSGKDAIIGSIKANLANILPMIVYSILAGIMFFIGAIPFGLGLLVVMPIFLASGYVATRDIFRL